MTRSSRRMFMELQAIQRMARPVKLRRIARNRRGFAAGLCAEEAKLRSALYQHHTVYRIRAVEMVRTFLRLLLVLLIAPLNASPGHHGAVFGRAAVSLSYLCFSGYLLLAFTHWLFQVSCRLEKVSSFGRSELY
ncbi:hypothetical protein IWX49DRAFT_317679 [Phyllosticta citricarpa]|uniref:Transmembrane protein n=1 Tax=Phyllosticta paracitricarpa TaxID=2016321 RepID=A0ABR1MXH8_9PEZI